MELQKSRGAASSSSKCQYPPSLQGIMPRKTCFVFTEEHALRKIVVRLLKDCPTITRLKDREAFLVKLLDMMSEEEEEEGSTAEQEQEEGPADAAAAASSSPDNSDCEG